jgi:hypothetical protein
VSDTPLLTIYTPTYRRPKGLARCRASVQAQTASELVEHLVVEDTVGVGVDGMHAGIIEQAQRARGQWFFVLSDDDVLPDVQVVEDFARLVSGGLEADVVMAHGRIGTMTYPSPQCWRARPQQGHVSLSNWFVRTEIACTIPYGRRYEGDFDHIAAVWDAGYRFAWWPRLVCLAPGWNRGRPEEGA